MSGRLSLNWGGEGLPSSSAQLLKTLLPLSSPGRRKQSEAAAKVTGQLKNKLAPLIKLSILLSLSLSLRAKIYNLHFVF